MKLVTAITVAITAAPLGLAVAVATLVAATCTTVPICTAAPATPPAVTPAGTAPSRGPITNAELRAITRDIDTPVPTYSILRDASAYGTGWGGPSINMLAPTMKRAVARLELAMGARLTVVSGYRTAGYQAQLCPNVAGPCAPPGRSMHQHGLAVDATNWHQALPHLTDVGLCQPLPATDANHLSHVTGREC